MNLVVGHTYEVVVKEIKPGKGIVVYFKGTEETFFIHISGISKKFVANIEDFVTCGEILTAECIEGKMKPLELSLHHLCLENRVPSAHRSTSSAYPRRQKEANSHQSAIKHVEKMMSKPSPTLDEMIEQSNAVLREKMSAKNARYDRK